MKLVDQLSGAELALGDTIKDDFGSEWVITGYDSHGRVDVINVEKYNKVVERYFVGAFALKVEV